jgi:hypothetical protein
MLINFKKLLIFLAIAIALSNSLFSSALAATDEFQFQSQTGYLIKGTFDYDKVTEGKIISAKGRGKTDDLQSLTVSFYDPQGKLIRTYENVVDRIATGNYFEFHFDPQNRQLIGNLDLGGEVAGEMYVKGTMAGELNLIEVESSDRDRLVDSFVTLKKI